MSDFVGMSINEVRQLSKFVEKEASEIDSAEKKVTSKIQSSSNIWKGKDADNFRSDWNGRKKELQEAVQVLRDAAKAMDKNASDQEAASNR
jgi:WXG100 family type VII secretion target